jgi:hypothetical protein
MKYSLLEWSSLIISILAIFWITLVYTFSPCLPPELQKIDKKELFQNGSLLNGDLSNGDLSNGDLLFLSGSTFAEKVIKFWHNSYYSHVAIIFEDYRGVKNPTKENTLFVWESDIGQNTKEGPRIMKLSDKLNKWKGDKIGMIRKYYGPRPSTLNIMNIVVQHIGKGMDLNMTAWFFSEFPDSTIFKHFKKNGEMFCSELVAKTLQSLDIIEDDRHPASYTPQDFSVIVPKKGFYSFPIYFKTQ